MNDRESIKTTPVLDVLNSPWAITDEKLREIVEIYSAHLRGDKIDLASIEASIGRPLDNERRSFDSSGGTAVIPVHGVIAKRMNLMMRISGGTSTQILGDDLDRALEDPAIHSIVLSIDSPGGTVDGTQAIADQIYESRGKKPIYAVADGMAGSAAYWIASAADKVFASGDTTAVGSIGVVLAHVDYSEGEKKHGVKVTEITAGKYKRIAGEHAPLSKEGKEYLQGHVDHMYSVFIDNVARNRGVTTDQALSMADGKIFLGKNAAEVGLVDGVSTIPKVVAMLNRDYFGKSLRSVATVRAYTMERTASIG